MSCPRCDHDDITRLAVSPVPGVWEVHHCERCLYTWRSSEPARRTSREHYPERFRLTTEDLTHAPEVPTVPGRRADR